MILGIADDLLSADEPRSHYLTKVGGVPWVPTTGCGLAPNGCDWAQSTTCKVCGRSLSLVFQAYAPLTSAVGGRVIERVLLVLGCTHADCGTDARSWRAFRCQQAVGRSEAAATVAGSGDGANHEAAPPASKKIDDKPLKPSHVADPCGFPLGTSADAFGCGFECDEGFGALVCAAGTGGGADSSALDFSDLGAVLEDCAAKQLQQQQPPAGASRSDRSDTWGAAASKGGAVADPIAASGSDACTPSVALDVAGPLLPEFHIIAIAEPDERQGGVRRDEHDHVQRLLEEYQRREGLTGEDPASTRPTNPDGGSMARPSGSQHMAPGSAPGGRRSSPSMQQGMGGSDDGGGGSEGVGDSPGAEGDDGSSWAGEEYEEDHVRGVQGPYLKFAARLRRQPDQCARYSREGQVLWPLQHPPQPSPCTCCGAPRVFEMQLMAPLLAVVLECAEWLHGPELERHRAAINAAANWDFATLAVYTCSANCQPMGQALVPHGSGSQVHEAAVLVEECVHLVSEAQCHVPEELKVGM